MSRGVPPGWVETTIEKLFRMVGGGTPSTSRADFWGDGIPWITSADIDDAGNITPRKAVTIAGIEASATNVVPQNSVIVVSRVGLGKVALAMSEICFSQDCQALLFEPKHLHPGFVAHQVRFAVRGIRGRGTTISGVTGKELAALSFFLPPLAAQRRIVDAIDSYFTRLDDVMVCLERVQAKLDQYRASVLNAAVEGRLVSRQAVLARARGRRKEAADAHIARSFHKQGTDNCAIDRAAAMLPPLPEGWSWANVGQLVERLDQGWSPRCDKRGASHNEWGVMKTTAVQHLAFVEEENKALPADMRPRETLELRVGDLLVTRAGPRTRVGVCCLVRRTRPRIMLCDKVYRLRVHADYSAAYLEIALNSPRVLSEIEKLKTGISDSGVNLTQERFKDLVIPLPPRSEQDAIELAVAEQLSIVDIVERSVTADRRRVRRLRQSILKWAFEGKLVAQDQNDTASDDLLAQIRSVRGGVHFDNAERNSAL